jgi:uncharacterized protein YbjT (DUF2867 family)
MKVLVIGGTGRIGSKVVQRLRDAGHEVNAASPQSGVDILTGEGLDAAMQGVSLVVDLANSPPPYDGDAPMKFFRTAGQNILAAEKKAGVKQHVALSIVGTDRTGLNDYFLAKAEQERLIRESGIPYTIIHSTQFFDFLPGIIQSGTEGDTVRLSSAMVQLISAEDVAEAVSRSSLEPPKNGVVEIAGPERESIADAAQRFMRATHDTREVVVDAKAPYFGVALDRDALVPLGDAWKGSMDFQGWLAQSEYAQSTQGKSATQ